MTRICSHCRAPIDAASQRTDSFCSAGCARAHTVIEDAGLARFYTLDEGAPRARGRDDVPVRPWLDALLESPGAVRVDVQGLSCGACVWLIERFGKRQQVACTVVPGIGAIEIPRDPQHPVERAQLEAFFDDVEAVGYRLGPPRKGPDALADDLLVRTGACAALAMIAMTLAFARYFGLDAAHDPAVAKLFGFGELLAATGSIVVGGSWFGKNAIAALRRRVIHMDLPIAVGVGLAYAGSVLTTLGDHPSGRAAFFDTVSMFIALMLIGRLVQRRLLVQGRMQMLADQGIDGLTLSRIDASGAPHAVAAAAVKAGDRLLFAAGDVVLVDGTAATAGALSLAWITGESDEQRCEEGAPVRAGARVMRHALEVVATVDMERSSLHALLAQRASDEPEAGPFWRRLATAWVIGVLALGALALFLWRGEGGARALEVATAVLIVTCPCAIGLAAPLAVELATAKLRKRGVFVRRAGLFERMARVHHMVFDKTGTLTDNELVLTPASRAALLAAPPAVQQAAFDLSARSSHPKSRAIARALEGTALTALEVEETAGVGLRATVDGARVTLTRAATANEAAADRDSSNAVALTINDEVALTLAFEESLKLDARKEIEALRARGIDLHIASGDDAAHVAAVADALGVPAVRTHAGLTPEGKARLVRSLEADRVLMIGDGVNDAPAFAAAGVAGTPAIDQPQLPARADFIFIGAGVGPLSALVDTSRRLRTAIRAALAFALLYNTAVVLVALAGVMTPLLCALLMPSSSVVVLTIVFALMRTTPTLEGARRRDARRLRKAGSSALSAATTQGAM